MFDDPILQELWALRETEAAKFNFDVDAIFDDFERRERESGREFVTFPPNRIVPTFPTNIATIPEAPRSANS